MYRASAGTVYPILQELEDESLIVSELREGKKGLRIDRAGEAGNLPKRTRPSGTYGNAHGDGKTGAAPLPTLNR